MIITYKNIKKLNTNTRIKRINLELKESVKTLPLSINGIKSLKSLKNKTKSKKYLTSTLNLTENLLTKNDIKKSQFIEKKFFKKP